MSKNPVRNLQLVFIILISICVGYYIGVNKITFDWKNTRPTFTIQSKEPSGVNNAFNFSPMWTVLDKVTSSYYDKSKIDPQKMVGGAIAGMLSTLDDPYTLYLPPKQNSNFKQGLAGQFSGIGAELGIKNKDIVVIAPIAGSPAEKAGVRAGDVIQKVEDQSVSGWTLEQAVDKIRGPKGTQVHLTILHKDDGGKSKDVSITRDTITVKSVEGWVKKTKDVDNIKVVSDKSVAYVRLSQFGDNTNKDWLALVNKLDMQIRQSNAVGFILDLRNNPGGYLTDAQYIASEFIKDGVIVTQDNGSGDVQTLSVIRQGQLSDIPMVVLINKGSASASEIVAGALRDHGRAKLVGETSFGKGTVQQAEDLGNGAGLHVTIAKWLTPNGTWAHGKGLTPDVTVKLNEKDPTRDTQLEKAVELLVQ